MGKLTLVSRLAVCVSFFALLFSTPSDVSAQSQKFVKVNFQTGIYRDWDDSWMTTAPEGVVATMTTSKGVFKKSPANDRGFVSFANVPCGESVKINIQFVGTGSYALKSRDYVRRIACGKSNVNLGKLEYGKW